MMQLPKELAPPENCPHCGTKVFIDGAFPFCPNFHCWYRTYGRLRKYVEVLDIKGAGETTLQQMTQAGYVKTPADLFKVTEQQYCNLERQGSKGYKKFVEGLKVRSSISTAEVFAALDIEGLGTFEAICAVPGLQTPQQIMAEAKADNRTLFAQALRVSVERAEGITKQIRDRIEEIEALLEFVSIKKAGDKLLGKSICITGSLSRPRHSIESDIKDLGGRVESSVTSRTTHLVCNEVNSNSSKMQKARKQGTRVITEEELNTLMKG